MTPIKTIGDHDHVTLPFVEPEAMQPEANTRASRRGARVPSPERDDQRPEDKVAGLCPPEPKRHCGL